MLLFFLFRKDKKEKKVTAEDVHKLQYRVLEKELLRQDIEMKKLNLQVQVLEKLNNKFTNTNSPSLSQVWATILN